MKNELIDFIKKVKKIGLAVGVETNGSNPEAIEYLIKNELVDYIAMDIKGSFEQGKYNQLTGINAPVDKIKKSVKIIVEKAPDYEFRTTVVPGLLTEEDILEIAADIKGAKRYYLQQFQQTRTYADEKQARTHADKNKSWIDTDSATVRQTKVKNYSEINLEEIGEKIKNYFQIFEVRL
jgi:pyruvate formate lyase activating enzyme